MWQRTVIKELGWAGKTWQELLRIAAARAGRNSPVDNPERS